MNITRSFFPFENVELRVDGTKKTLTGYAAMFEKLSNPISGFREKIRRGAFSETIKKTNIKALWNHNTDLVLGSTGNGTLRLEEDNVGLKFDLDLPDTQWGRDAAVSVSRKDVDGMSFAFNVKNQEWDESDKSKIVRTLIEVDLFEVSPTAFPAYQQTSVTARSVKEDYSDFSDEKNKSEMTQIAKNKLELNNNLITQFEKELLV